MHVCLWPHTVNFKQVHLNISQRLNVLRESHAQPTVGTQCQREQNPDTQVNTHMAIAVYDKQGQGAQRQYKLCTVVEFASGKGHAESRLISIRDSELVTSV